MRHPTVSLLESQLRWARSRPQSSSLAFLLRCITRQECLDFYCRSNLIYHDFG